MRKMGLCIPGMTCPTAPPPSNGCPADATDASNEASHGGGASGASKDAS
ncbi:MAG TPA: hypothetical protein VGR54_09565 [Nitrosopumilaceae archaeon]|nr:hypothetical protein [Nitrosopumilaceae archaeon]